MEEYLVVYHGMTQVKVLIIVYRVTAPHSGKDPITSATFGDIQTYLMDKKPS